MSLDDTRTATQSLHPADAAPRPGVLLIDHPDPRFVGISRVIEAGESIVLGRGSEALIPGVFVDGRTVDALADYWTGWMGGPTAWCGV